MPCLSLEVGCGSGVDSAYLANFGFISVGMDYSMSAQTRFARCDNSGQSPIYRVTGDTLAIPFNSNSFDLVFSQGLMEHFRDMRPALREQIRVLKSGGLICVDVPQTWNLATIHKRWHIMRGTWFAGWETNYSLEELEELLREYGLKVVDSYGWLYFPSLMYGIRNLHTLNERYKLPIWLPDSIKEKIEGIWLWFENQRWYYRWLGCIGVIAQKF
jgi:SAM-dependent methyltransferase